MNWFLSLVGKITHLLPDPIKKLPYRIPPLARFLRRLFNRAAPIGMNKVKVASGILEGYFFNLDMQTEKDFWLGTYEMDLQTSLRQLVKPGMIAYDVGANIGYISLMLAHLVGSDGKVFSFEALPSNTIRWQENISLNGLSDRTHLIHGAVADRQSTIRFLVHASGGMGKVIGSAGREETYKDEIEVPGISLDDFVFYQNNPAPDVIKLDIEGGEVLALPGMRRVLSEAQPALLMELHGQESIRVSWEILSDTGYRICRMKPGFPVVHSIQELDWKSYLVAFPGTNKN
jgi:FkbM family methyltransferase